MARININSLIKRHEKKEEKASQNKRHEQGETFKHAEYQMNPFEFVPVSAYGPKKLSNVIMKEKRFEGFLEYDLKVITPLHISGKISVNRIPGKDKKGRTIYHQVYNYKDFYNTCGGYSIPGSSIRGVLESFLESLTNSDFTNLTPEYKQKHGDRFVGIQMKSGQNCSPSKGTKFYGDPCMTRKVLPKGYNKTEKIVNVDVVQYMFGFVKEDKKKKKNEQAPASKGRLIFENINIDPFLLKDNDALDVVSKDSVFGVPNIRGNTAWYFNANENLLYRKTRGHDTYHALAETVRGRKFYFHQSPKKCIQYYKDEWNTKLKVSKLKEYQVKCVQPTDENASELALTGKVYFTDLPKSLLNLLIFALNPGSDMGHKMGGLKPFGFGSVQFQNIQVKKREINRNSIFSSMNDYTPNIGKKDIQNLIDQKAWQWLKTIHRMPKNWDSTNHLFVYPKFGTGKTDNPYKKDFAKPQAIPTSAKEHNIKMQQNKLTEHDKLTFYFDMYQRNAANFKAVMGEYFSKNDYANYTHEPYDPEEGDE